MAKGNPNPKSRKGVPNKATQSLREMLDGALKAKGGQAWIEEQMDRNPNAVLALLGRTLPRVVDVDAKVEAKSFVIMASQQDIDL